MSKLPDKYKWLEAEPAPQLLKQGLSLYGVLETPGEKDNPLILSWAKELGLQNVYTKDSIPWCGLWVGICVKRIGHKPVNNMLWALSWAAWSVPIENDKAMLGDVLVFTRDGGGHVGLYVGEDSTHFHVLGGNQSDSVSITRIDKKRLYAVRRTKWQVAQPANVRKVFLDPKGTPVTVNEK